MVQVQIPADSYNGEIYIYSMAWSPDSRLLLVDGQSGAIVRRYTANTALSHSNTAAHSLYLRALLPTSGISGFVSVAWSPDQRFLAVSLASNIARLEVLHAQTGTPAFDLPVSTSVLPTELAWSPDSQYLASFSNVGYGQTLPQTSVQVWQVVTRRPVFQHAGIDAPDGVMAWLPGSLDLAFFVSDERQLAGLSVWDIARDQQIRRYALSCQNPLVWLPDGRAFACIQQNNVLLIDAASGRTASIHDAKGIVSALACSPDGMYLASGEGGETAFGPTGHKHPGNPSTVTVWVA